MSAKYWIGSHPLLSPAARALDNDVLEAHALIAERVLGLRALELSGSAADEAASYVARQMNLQVRLESTAGDIVSESKGGQSYTYQQVGGRRVAVDTLALTGARLLAGDPPLASSSSAVITTW